MTVALTTAYRTRAYENECIVAYVKYVLPFPCSPSSAPCSTSTPTFWQHSSLRTPPSPPHALTLSLPSSCGGPKTSGFLGCSAVAAPFKGCLGRTKGPEEEIKVVEVDLDVLKVRVIYAFLNVNVLEEMVLMNDV